MQKEITRQAEEEIIRLTVKIQRIAPFYSYIIMHMRCTAVADASFPTGAVNANGDLFYNPVWFMGLTKDERIFFLLHEASHMSLLSHMRAGNRDKTIWNIATDLIINQMLVEDGYTPIKDCLVPNLYGDYILDLGDGESHSIAVVGRVAEQVYEDLIKILPAVEQLLINDSGGTGSGSESSYKGGFDGHIYEVSNEDEPADPLNGRDISEKDIDTQATKWRRVISSANVVAKQAGKQSSIQQRCLEKILKPEVDWKTVLSRFIQNKLPTDLSMRRPGRRSASLGYYTPSIIKEGIHVVVAPDVSGSIGESEYIRFMSEIHSILHSTNQIHLTMIPWAADVLDEDVVDIPIGTRKNIFDYKIRNSGGTLINSVGNYIDNKNIRPDLCVVFTDGYVADTPKKLRCNTLAIISKGGDTESLREYATQVTCLDNEGI